MAGHSHFSNVKYKKERRDDARSHFFLKLRQKITNMIKTEGKISEKVLSLARQSKFPKQKVYEIYERIHKDNTSFVSESLFLSPQGILIYLCSDLDSQIFEEFKLKKIPSTLIKSYFQPVYLLLLENGGDEIAEKLSVLPISLRNIDYESNILSSLDKQAINNFKTELKQVFSWLKIREKTIWKPLLTNELDRQDLEYYSQLTKKLEGKIYYTNIIYKE